MRPAKKTALIGALCLFASSGLAAPADTGLDIFVNGKYVGRGFSLHDTTWVPLRVVSEALGASVGYNAAKGQILINNGVSAVPEAAETPDPPSTVVPVTAEMHEVASFDGDTGKNTDPFTVGKRWRIEWESKPNSGDDPTNFIADIVRGSDGETFDSLANVIGAHSSTSQEYKAGTYYLKIQTSQHYTIRVFSK